VKTQTSTVVINTYVMCQKTTKVYLISATR